MYHSTRLLRSLLPLALLAPLAPGCSVDAEPAAELDVPPPIQSIYVAPASLTELDGPTFFDHPWPSDLRLENGSPRVEGFPNPRQVPILASYINWTKGNLAGFSPAAAGFVRFAGPIDEATLPATPKDSLLPTASVQLIDIDPDSPEHGERQLVSVHWRADEGAYWPTNTLAFMPTLGFPLRPHTRYAVVVTDTLRGKGGATIEQSPDLRQVLDIDRPDARTAPVRDALAPAVAELDAAGIEKEHIVQLSVFTTSDPTAELFAVRDHLLANVEPPRLRGPVTLHRKGKFYDEYVGLYGPSPNYQEGKLPFTKFGDGGGFRMKDGKPEVVDLFYLRFTMAVPKPDECPMPEAGYPIVLYAHGTGGDHRSFLYDGTAASLAKQCLASMGVDQIFHGTRPGSTADENSGTISLLFFNAQNIVSARTNGRQGALDEVQRARLFTESKISFKAATTNPGAEIRFDASKLMFFGHSQGGLNGPLYLAADPSARGGVLSGSSAVMSITLNEKTMPSPSVANLVRLIFLGLNDEEAQEVSPFHPAISLAQMLVDVVDPIHYARYVISEPRDGSAPKSIYMTEGINPDGRGDSYAPPHGIEAHAIAMGLPLQLPSQRSILEAEWGGPGSVSIPAGGLSGNLAGGAATGVLAQWAVPEESDGHFVIFRVAEAKAQAAGFLRSLADQPPGRLPAP